MIDSFLTPNKTEFEQHLRVVCLVGFHVVGFVKNADDFRAVTGDNIVMELNACVYGLRKVK